MAAPSFQLSGIKLLGSCFTLSFRDHVLFTSKFYWFCLKHILGVKLCLAFSPANALVWSSVMPCVDYWCSLLTGFPTSGLVPSSVCSQHAPDDHGKTRQFMFLTCPKPSASISFRKTMNSFHICPPLACLSNLLSYQFSLIHTPFQVPALGPFPLLCLTPRTPPSLKLSVACHVSISEASLKLVVNQQGCSRGNSRIIGVVELAGYIEPFLLLRP